MPETKKLIKIVLFGFATWFLPFIFSFLFVDQSGTFVIPQTFFKSIMVVTGALVGTAFALKYFQSVKKDYLKEGVKIGFIWLCINLALDVAMVYSGFFQMTLMQYFTDIGLRYLSIPIFTIGIGYALEKK